MHYVLLYILAAFALGASGASLWLIYGIHRRRHVQETTIQQLQTQLRELSKRLDIYFKGSVGMGEELHRLNSIVTPLPERLNQIEQRDPSSVSFTQAAHLISMGASTDDIARACGLTQAEAELIGLMHNAVPPGQ